MNHLIRLPALFLTLLLSACLSDDNPPADAPANVTATAGENLIAVSWDEVAGKTYWLYYKQGDSVGLDDFDGILTNVSSPHLLTGLTNATPYTVAITSSEANSAVGPFSPGITLTPRLLSPAINWTIGTSLSTNNLNSISYAFNNYVTVGDAASLFTAPYSYTDTGGVTAWTQVSSLPVDTSTNLTSIIHDGIRFIALGDDGSIITSTDTEIWSSATAIVSSANMNAITVAPNLYIAVGNAGGIYTNSHDGINGEWSEQDSGTTNNLYGISYDNGHFIAVGASGTLLSSTDGISWTTQSSGTSSDLRGSAYGADTHVVIGDAGAIVSSTDAANWTIQALATTESLRDIVFGPDQQFIAVGSAGTVAYSETGEDGSWVTANAGTIDLNSLASNFVFIATGDAGSNVSAK